MEAGDRAGSDGGDRPSLQFVSYAEFGEEFFRKAVTEQRVLGAVNALAGQPIKVGPTGVGPGRLAKLRADGVISEGTISTLSNAPMRFRARLPLDLSFEIDLGVEPQKFKADVVIPLTLTAKAARGLKLFIHIDTPDARDIEIDVRAHGLRASVLQRVGGIDDEVRRFVAKYVAQEISSPQVRRATLLDVAASIGAAWVSLAPPD